MPSPPTPLPLGEGRNTASVRCVGAQRLLEAAARVLEPGFTLEVVKRCIDTDAVAGSLAPVGRARSGERFLAAAAAGGNGAGAGFFYRRWRQQDERSAQVMDYPGWWRIESQRSDEESDEIIPMVPPSEELALFAMRCAGGDLSLFRTLCNHTDFAELIWLWVLRVFARQ